MLGSLGLGPSAGAAAVVVTAGTRQITFAATAKNGVVGDANGYDTLAFDLENGQGGMGRDIQIGSGSSGQATLSGSLEVVPPGGTTSGTPTSATVPATVGEKLLVLDSAGNYVLVQITRATSQTVWFSYRLQSSVTTVQPPASTPQSQPATSPSTTPSSPTSSSNSTSQQSSSGSGRRGVYAIPGNCATVSDTHAKPALQIGVNVTPMFPDQSVAAAKQNMELYLDVAIAAPKDVSKVAVQQSGVVGSYAWTDPLHPLGQGGNGEWQFSMQQTSTSKLYRILITSPTLAADGIADPSTGVTELDWRFDTTKGCGQSANSGQGRRTGQGRPRGSAASALIQLRIGSSTATVNGHAENLAVPARVDAAGRTLVPFRWLGQAIGATVRSDSSSRTESYQLGSMDVAVTTGKTTAIVNGRNVVLDAPAVIIDGSTLVPVRFVSQALGALVRWDASTQTLTITYRTAAGSRTSGQGSAR